MADAWDPKGEAALRVLVVARDVRGDVYIDRDRLPDDGWVRVSDVAPWLSAADQAAYLAVVRAAIEWNDDESHDCDLRDAVDALTAEQRARVMGGEK